MVGPLLYPGWAILVVAALTISYFGDPYIFAFTTLIAAGISFATWLLGLAITLFSKAASGQARVWILVSNAVASA